MIVWPWTAAAASRPQPRARRCKWKNAAFLDIEFLPGRAHSAPLVGSLSNPAAECFRASTVVLAFAGYPHRRSAHEEGRLLFVVDVSSRRICAAHRSRDTSQHRTSCPTNGSGTGGAVPPSSVDRRLLGMASEQASLGRGTLDLAAVTLVCLATGVVGEQGRRLVFPRGLLAAR